MTFELLTVHGFFPHFGDGYCVEMPSDKRILDNLLDYLSDHKAKWKFYATLANGRWFHGIHIAFQNRKRPEAEALMRHVCELLKINSCCLCEGGSQTIIDREGEVVAFADFSEEAEREYAE